MTKYVSIKPDQDGIVQWRAEDDAVWSLLVNRQMHNIPSKACREYLDGLALLDLDRNRAPQLNDINKVLEQSTGWRIEPVPALINFDRFFKLLSEKKFPAATFMRSEEEIEYLQEPDFFHEIFGHCAMLTNPSFAEFTHQYGLLGAKASKEDRVYLARLYWFTVEFGLVGAPDDYKVYGGGILSSPSETNYVGLPDKKSTGKSTPRKCIVKKFDAVDIMRTPYRIDIMQPIYFAIDSIEALLELTRQDIMSKVEQAKALGLHSPMFPPKEEQPTPISNTSTVIE
ncbi:phenylalanine 4-monooxygenase [Aliivibrio kagoshimensis]|uniref:phenylalanine 4-monooxygenase n=1 Tax=Aliivibrio kagoshimensis TaxID=2910230 RepID=UPI003D10F06D